MGGVENYLQNQLKRRRALLFILIDSETSDSKLSIKLAKTVEKIGASAILVGGSSASNQIEMAQTVKNLKKSIKIPIILFPGNTTGVVPKADAILFSSLLNSENPYFVSQAQALGAPDVMKYGLEALPTAYLVIGEGTSAWFVGSARGIPFSKSKIAAMYALSAQYLGMRFVYLEAGSGASTTVRPEMVKAVRKVFNGFLIVGGGIRDAKTAKRLVQSGANALVIGTLTERKKNLSILTKIAKAIQK